MQESEGEEDSLLAEQRLAREGLHVKLDRGFETGRYYVYVEYDDLQARIGFTAARRQARAFGALLQSELLRCSEQRVGWIADAAKTGDPRRRHDLELSHLSFEVTTQDGRYHDQTMKDEFGLALLRAGQPWDQRQARAETRRRANREERFRTRLDELLAGDAYQHVDTTTKQRLLDDIPPLAFPPRLHER
jgi:hypothetical protein